jgi:hypothetical protein
VDTTAQESKRGRSQATPAAIFSAAKALPDGVVFPQVRRPSPRLAAIGRAVEAAATYAAAFPAVLLREIPIERLEQEKEA